MSCNEFWIAGTVASSGHIEECARCASAWKRDRAMAAGLRTAAAQGRMVEAPMRVEDRLIAAFRGHAGLGSRSAFPRWVPAVTWISAAAAIGLVAILLIRDRDPKPVRPAAPNVMQYAAVFAGEEDFIPLPGAAELDAGDEMNLVRLELPRSAVLAWGLEVSGEGGDSDDEAIAADVMIGPDGEARAVRILEE